MARKAIERIVLAMESGHIPTMPQLRMLQREVGGFESGIFCDVPPEVLEAAIGKLERAERVGNDMRRRQAGGTMRSREDEREIGPPIQPPDRHLTREELEERAAEVLGRIDESMSIVDVGLERPVKQFESLTRTRVDGVVSSVDSRAKDRLRSVIGDMDAVDSRLDAIGMNGVARVMELMPQPVLDLVRQDMFPLEGQPSLDAEGFGSAPASIDTLVNETFEVQCLPSGTALLNGFRAAVVDSLGRSWTLPVFTSGEISANGLLSGPIPVDDPTQVDLVDHAVVSIAPSPNPAILSGVLQDVAPGQPVSLSYRFSGCQPGDPTPGPLPEPIPDPEPEPEPEPCSDDRICETLERIADCLCRTEEDRSCDQVWIDTEQCELYTLRQGDEPRNDSDQPIAGADTVEQLRALLNRVCPAEDSDDESDDDDSGDDLETIGADGCQFIPPAIAALFSGEDVWGRIIRDAFGELPSAEAIREQLRSTPAFANLMGIFLVLPRTALEVFSRILNVVFEQFGCTSPEQIGLRVMITVMGFAERYLGAGFTDVITPLIQQARYNCPLQIPTLEQAHRALLTDQISNEQWECFVRANGFKADDQSAVFLSSQSRLGVNELINARRRGVIGVDTYFQEMRHQGFLDDRFSEWLFTISEQRPGVGDLVRFMVRDVDDPSVVERFTLDAQFTDKFQGLVKQWAEETGVPEEYMTRVWRAHWEFPSPTQLGFMWQRLRQLPPGNPARVEREDIETALVTQDINPFWVPKFMALLERPLTRVDARRMLEAGIISRDEAILAWQKIGYSDADAERFVDLATQIAKRRAVKHPAVKRYVSGELSSIEARGIMLTEGIAPTLIDDAFERAKIELAASVRKSCIAALRRRFMLGEFATDEVRQELLELGSDFEVAIQIADGWSCQRRKQGREIATGELCSLFMSDLIDESEYFQRMRRLGYEAIEAELIIKRCQVRKRTKLTKEAEAEQKRRDKELAELVKTAQADAKERERQMKESEKRTEKLARTRKRLRKLKLDTAKVMAKKLELPISAVDGLVNGVVLRLKSGTFATEMEVLEAARASADDATVETIEALEQSALEILNERIFASPLGDDQPGV